MMDHGGGGGGGDSMTPSPPIRIPSSDVSSRHAFNAVILSNEVMVLPGCVQIDRY